MDKGRWGGAGLGCPCCLVSLPRTGGSSAGRRGCSAGSTLCRTAPGHQRPPAPLAGSGGTGDPRDAAGTRTATERNRHRGKGALATPAGCRAGTPRGPAGQESHHCIQSVHELLLSASEYLNERFHIAVKELMIID